MSRQAGFSLRALLGFNTVDFKVREQDSFVFLSSEAKIETQLCVHVVLPALRFVILSIRAYRHHQLL